MHKGQQDIRQVEVIAFQKMHTYIRMCMVTVHKMYRPGSNQHMIFAHHSASLLSLFLLDLQTYSFLMCHMC